MDLRPAHERTLGEFVGKKPSVDPAYGRWNEEAFLLHRAPHLGPLRKVERNFFCTPPALYGTSEGTRKLHHCYSLAVLEDDPAYAVLLQDTIDAVTGGVFIPDNPVGEFYRDGFGLNILGVLESVRGKGVGPHFVAAAVEATGNVEPSGAYSPAGLATRRRAHRILVEKALRRGQRVPARVLAEYPDLR